MWDELIDECPEVGARSSLVVAAYCEAVARLEDVRARIWAEGAIVADEKGRPVPHPAIPVEKAVSGEVRAWAEKLGLLARPVDGESSQRSASSYVDQVRERREAKARQAANNA